MVIGGEVLEVKKQSKGVPEQLVVQHYLAKLITRWLSLRSCGRDVYAPNHPESYFFIQSANLILARLEFLKDAIPLDELGILLARRLEVSLAGLGGPHASLRVVA